MTTHWHIHPQTGFLLAPYPLQHLGDIDSRLTATTITTLETLAHALPQATRADLADMPLYDFSTVGDDDPRIAERLFLLYGYFANAYVHQAPAVAVLPRVLAMPLVQLAAHLGRPPILAYAGMVLGNWWRHDPTGAFTPHNVDVRQRFTPLIDEAWFFRVHIAIEAQAGAMLTTLLALRDAIISGDDGRVLDGLRDVRAGLVQITRTFHQMPDLCDPDVYYQQVRPYLFGFTDVDYDGVPDAPRNLRGGSGAQSSIVPFLLGALGIEHAQTDLTRHLYTMRAYMPRPHQQAIAHISTLGLRAYCAERPPLRDAYNHVLRQLMTFRRAHLYYAREYIFAKTTNPVGTGGTDFMHFLNRLIAETDAQQL